MKTSIRIIAIFIVLTFITSDLAIAQSRVNNPTSVITEQPVSQTQQAGTGGRTSRNTIPPSVLPSSDIIIPETLGIAQEDQARQFLNNLRNFQRSTGTSTGTRTSSDNILVIPTEEVGFEELLTINEDMNVMSRIFANELGKQRTATSNPGWSVVDSQLVPTYYELILGRSTNNTISSMYLQGYGALFMMKVDFPLSGPPEPKPQQEETEKEDVDEIWEQTRQQIYQPREPRTTSSRISAERPEVNYDARQVENLKTALIESLKHAANIRVLAPDESVIIRIDGSGRSITVLSIAKQDNGGWLIDFESDGIRKMMSINSADINDFVRRFSVPMCIDIRAKKSDIDAFAKGDLDFDKFREKVQVLSYPLLSGSAGGTPVSRTRTTGRTNTYVTTP